MSGGRMKLLIIRQIALKCIRFVEMVYIKFVYVRAERGACGSVHCRRCRWTNGI